MAGISRILHETGAVLENGHFVYTSGFHGSTYVNKDAVYSDVLHMAEIGKMLARVCPRPDAVLGPAVGGALLAQWVAYAFSSEDMLYRYIVPAVYADKEGEGFIVKRGYDRLIAGKKVLVVEDILNTGDSARKTVKAAQKCGAEVIGVGVLCNRGGLTAELLDVPFLDALTSIRMVTYAPDSCPLCQEGIPINTSVGHGKRYLDSLENIDAGRDYGPLPG